MRFLAMISATLSTAVFSASASGGDIRYTVTDLGTFGGSSRQSGANAINDAGQIVGWSADPVDGFFANAAYFPPGASQPVDLGTLDGQTTSVSIATAVNIGGIVVGYSDSGSTTGAFLWTGSGAIQNIPMPTGGTGASAYGINNLGTVVGGFSANGTPRGFVDTNGIVTTTTMVNLGINDSGQMIEIKSVSPFTTEQTYLVNPGGSPQNIGSLGGSVIQGSAINSKGQIVGFSELTGNSTSHGFLYSSGTLTDLGTLPGSNYSQANDINDLGTIVGVSDIGSQAHAFIDALGTMSDLNEFIDPNSNWLLEGANGINSAGQIVGIGISPDGDEHAFLLIPVPEPPTAVLLIALGMYYPLRKVSNRVFAVSSA